MNDDWAEDRDPLLEAALGELLGGERPPDVTQRVIEALGKRTNGPGQLFLSEPNVSPAPLDVSCQATLSHQRGRGTSVSRRMPWAMRMVVSAVCIVLVGSVLGLTSLWLVYRPFTLEFTAQSEISSGKGIESLPSGRRSDPAPYPSSAGIAKREVPESGHPEPIALPAPFGGNNPPGVARRPTVGTTERFVEPWSDERIVEELDRRLTEKLVQIRLVAAPPATAAEFCRRAYLRLLGRIPTVDELQEHLTRKGPDARRLLVEQLVSDSRYRQEFNKYWAQYWTNTLLGRTAGTQMGDRVDREAFAGYLEEAFATDRPWNELVAQMLTATGTNRPGGDSYRPEVNFLVAHHSPDAALETAAVARLFLGRRYQCAQCHNHPFSEDLTQKRFWQVNALFRQTRVEQRGSLVHVTDGDVDQEVVFYEELNGVQRAVYPALPDGSPVAPSGKVSEVRRRELLARWIMQSEDLARATVNRVWAHFFGYGFTRPIDDLSPENPVSHPEVFDLLATQWRARGYSMRDLVRWIALSEAFARSSRVTETNIADMPEEGGTPWFSRYYARLLEPEAVYDSLRLVAEARRSLGPSPERQQFLGQFAHRMGTDDNEEADRFQGDIRQSLLLMTGGLMQKATSSEEGAVLRHVIQSTLMPEEKITHLFLAAIARVPTQRELQQGLKMLSEQPAEVALQDIWWALLNSNEFILDH